MNSMIFGLRLWADGTPLDTLAAMSGANHDEFESQLQGCLRELCEQSRALGFVPGEGDSRFQPSSPTEAPQQGAAQAKAADSSPSPLPRNCAAAMRKSPARRAVAKAVGEFADYPEALRDRRADRMRVVFDLLRQGPATVSELEIRLDTSAGEFDGDVTKWLCNGLYTLHAKGIVIKPDAPGGKWRLTEAGLEVSGCSAAW